MKYRKKPVVIEAVQLPANGDDKPNEFLMWAGLHNFSDWEYIEGSGIEVPTLEGNMLAKWNDWIIKGVQGEFYPCKPDIFEQTYEPAN